jgi:thioredoxin 1
MAERLLGLALFLSVCGGVWLVWRVWQQRRLSVLQQQPTPSPLGGVVQGGPALLYFSTVDCAQCRFQQAPILDRLSATVELPVVRLDAIEREDLARHFGIMTVPSTVLLDHAQKPVAINHGLAPLQKLQTQVAAVM